MSVIDRNIAKPPRLEISADAMARRGMLKIAEDAVRRNGPVVTLGLPGGRDMTVLAAPEHAVFWQQNTALFAKDLDQPDSGMSLTRAVLGPTLLTAGAGDEWRAMRSEMTGLLGKSKAWFRRPLDGATTALISDLTDDPDTPLLTHCLTWAERALCDPLVGPASLHAPAAALVRRLNAAFLDRLEGQEVDESTLAAAIRDTVARFEAGHSPNTIAAAALDADNAPETLQRVVVGLLAASLHINALSLVWCLILLARDPDLQTRLRAEAAACAQGPVRVADTPLAFATIREAQRLRPALPFIERQTTAATVIGGARLDKGATVLFSPWFAGRDKHAWPEPLRFEPDRFAPGRKQPPGGYYPFGIGPRICPGANLVNQQLTYAVSRLAGALTLAPHTDDRPGDFAPLFRINLEPRGPVRIAAQRH